MIVTCEHLAQQLSDLEEGRLSALEQKEAAFHLSWCKDCQAYVAQFRAARQHLQQLKSPTTPVAASSLQRALASFYDDADDADDADDDDDDDDDDDADDADTGAGADDPDDGVR